MNVFAEIKKLNFPADQYIVVGGGVLALRGIRETQDIDLVVAPELYEKCKSEGWREEMRPNDKPGLQRGNVELYLDINAGNFNPTFEELKTRQEIIQGIPCISLHDLLQFKQAYGRPKDVKDIETIKKRLV